MCATMKFLKALIWFLYLLLSMSKLTSASSSVFDCFKKSPIGGAAAESSKCLQSQNLCSNAFDTIFPAEVCDGIDTDCLLGQDESKVICEDKQWLDLDCPIEGILYTSFKANILGNLKII
jgi:hypothetical protein